MLGIGIVGCGMIARFHVRALNDIPGTRVAALFDAIPASAAKLQKENQEKWNITCDTVPDLETMLKRPDVDIVIITTPSGNHMEPALAAAEPPESTSSLRSRWRSRSPGATGSSTPATRTRSSSAPSSRRASATPIKRSRPPSAPVASAD